MDIDMDNVDIFDAVDSVNHLESTQVQSSCLPFIRMPFLTSLHFSRYYERGYQEGFEHGKLHGLFEGRELGQEKCFDWWEELGFIEGQAMFWKRLAVAQDNGRSDSKKINPRYVTLLEFLTI